MLKVSAIVPVYNVERYLEECLDSLARQSLRECEFICVDDGSEDSSYRIIETYVERDKRFKLIRQENKGQAEARNTGVRNAKGKYITFLDSDDFFNHKDTLKELYQKAEEYELEIISFETELLYQAAMKEKENKDRYEGIKTGKEMFLSMMSNREFCDSACLLFIEREWLSEQKIFFYPGIYYEDSLFCIQCFLCAGRMVHLSERFYTYRIREKSTMTGKIRWKNVYSRIVVYREILRMGYLPENAEPELQKALMNYLFQIVDQVFLQSMEIGRYRLAVNERVILNGLEKMVSDSEGVILYGAGNVGKLFYRFLNERNLDKKVLCYAVSRNPTVSVSPDGVRVLPVKEAVKKPGLIFLSVAGHDAQKEMKKTLHGLG